MTAGVATMGLLPILTAAAFSLAAQGMGNWMLEGHSEEAELRADANGAASDRPVAATLMRAFFILFFSLVLAKI